MRTSTRRRSSRRCAPAWRRARTRWWRRRRRGSWRISTTSAARPRRRRRCGPRWVCCRTTFVIGPFGEGRASLNAAFPPETEPAAPDLTKTYPGKTHEVGWRSGDAAMRDGVLYLDGMLRPADQAVAYAVAFVRSERDRAAVLRLGSPGPIKVWVNGAAVFTHDVVRPPSLDQDAVGIRLGRGWNRILIKTVHQRRRLAVVRARHGRRRDVAAGCATTSGAPPLPATMARRASASAPRADTLDALLERRARRLGAAGGRAWVDLARVLAWTTPRDRDDRAASVAFAQAFKLLQPTGSAVAPPEPALRLAAAEATDDDDERRRMLEQAVDAQPPPQWRALLLARRGRHGARGPPRRAGAGGVARGAGDRSRVLAGGAGDRPGRSGRRAAADRRDPPGGAARVQSGAAARAARGRAPVRRRGPAARGRSRAGRSRAGPAAGHGPDAPAVDPGAPPRRRRRGADAAGGGGGAAARRALAGDRARRA